MTAFLAATATDERSARLLPDHHAAVEATCRDLLARAHSDDSPTLAVWFRTFERALLDHLEAEEVAILPDYATYAPSDARAIRHEHTMIRQLLLGIGVEIELHQVRVETIAKLVDILRAHAAHEDTAMYPWAEVHLAPSTTHALSARIARSLRGLAVHAP
jgi:hypothetical protein